MWTYDLIERIGVVTHVRYSDGAYRNHAATIRKLAELGVRNLRDTAPKPQTTLPYRLYLEAGLRFSMSCSPAGPALTDARQAGEVLDRILAGFPEADGIDYLEGPNEPNNWPITFGGVKDTKRSFAAVTAYMEALHAAMRARPAFAHIPLLGVSNYPDIQVRSDADNAHTYPSKGAQPGASIARLAARPRRVVVTEFGYNTGPKKTHSGRVDEDTQAVLLLNTVLGAGAARLERLYIYELLDEKPDPQVTDPNLHWGLYRFDGSPKPAATGLRNLIRILAPEPAKGARGSVDIQVSGLPPAGRSLTLQKGPATWVVALWNEPDIWDDVADRPIRIASQPVTVRVPPAREVLIYDPLRSDAPIKRVEPAAAVITPLGAFPQLVELRL
jgi:hypothetical protein